VNDVVLFEPFPKQQEFLEAALSKKYQFVLYGGAIRGGKTFALLGLFILLARLYAGSRWAIVRKDLPVIKRNTYPSWEKIKPTNFIRKHNMELHQVEFKNGSKIIFFPENYAQDKELNRWRGLEVNGIGFEEINECSMKSFNKAFERAGSYVIPVSKQHPTPLQPPPLVVATCNPTQGWIKELVYDPWKRGELRKTWCYIQSRIYDNVPLLQAQPGLIDSYKANMPRYEYMLFVEGDWDVSIKTGGECYKSFELDKHVGNAEYDKTKPLHISWDENVNPYLPVGVFQIHENHIKQIYEVPSVHPENTVAIVCRKLLQKFDGHGSGVFIYGDATSRKDDTKLEQGQNFFSLIMDGLRIWRPVLRVPPANPSVVMRLRWINTWLETERDGMKLTIDESCKHSINDLLLIKETPDGVKFKEKERNPTTGVTYEKYGHFSDLFDYFVTTAFAQNFSRYQSGGGEDRARTGKTVRTRNSY
jgi:hypothetical protein